MTRAPQQSEDAAVHAPGPGVTTSPHPPNVIIRASAGTGKTFQLSNRYLQLILLGHAPQRILATTFTRKAAGEILDRVLFRLAKAAQDAEQTAALAKQLDLSQVTVNDCRQALGLLAGQLHRLRVSTLDSFFLQATQTLSLELGLPPVWQILDETQQEQLRGEAIARMLADHDAETVLQLLHWLAKGDTNRGVSQLLFDTVKEMYSLYLESPAEAWRRLPMRKGSSAAELRQLMQQLRSWMAESELNKRLQKAVDELLVATEAERWEALLDKGIGKKLLEGDATFYGKPLPADLVDMAQPVVAHARAELQNRVARQTEASYELLDRFHRHYDALKLDRRALQFDDLARHLGRLEEVAELSRLNFRLDAAIDCLLLDEFQDTSLDQWRVIRPFARYTSRSEPQRSFLCVGDAKQAIYGWRGGDAELMDAVVQELGNLHERSLDCSFRSAPAVIDVVNQINTGMGRHDNLDQYAEAIRHWVERFPRHTTSRQELPGYVSLETTATASTAEERRDSAIQRAADRVLELRSTAPQLSIAVLVRTNELVGRVMFALQERQIPASEEGGNPLTDSAAVQLVLSLLVLADCPQDSAARFHLATSPWAASLGLPSHTDSVAARRLSQNVLAALADVGYGQVVRGWAQQLKTWSNSRECRRLDQLVELAYQYQQQIETPRQVGYVRQHGLPISTAHFIQRIEQQRVADPTTDPVRVMNVHQAKGLQFDVVILPDLDRRLIAQTPAYAVDRPSATEPIETVVRYVGQSLRPMLPQNIQRVHEHDRNLRMREELSVLYVALTRAVYSLQMIIAADGANDSADDAGQPKRSPASKKLPSTIAGLIRAALTDPQPLEANQRVFEHGCADWLQRLPRAQVRQAAGLPVAPPKVALRSAASKGRAGAAPTLRPSQLEGSGRVRLADRLNASARSAMERGTLIHAFFEAIEWLEDGLPNDDTLTEIGIALDASPQQLASTITDFRAMLALPSIRQVLTRQRYQTWLDEGAAPEPADLRLEVRREQPITARDDDNWLTGNIDRLVLLCRQGQPLAAEILDFKTDAVPTPETLNQRVEFYRPQLQAYRRGVGRMLRIDTTRITMALLFVSNGRLVPLST